MRLAILVAAKWISGQPYPSRDEVETVIISFALGVFAFCDFLDARAAWRRGK